MNRSAQLSSHVEHAQICGKPRFLFNETNNISSLSSTKQRKLNHVEVTFARRRMIGVIEKLVRKHVEAEEDSGNDIHRHKKRQHKKSILTARTIEAKLYKSDQSFHAYADISTLEMRLKTLYKIIQNRQEAAQQQEKERHGHIQKRCKLLQTQVGDVQYNEVFRLFYEIRIIRRTSNVWTAVSIVKNNSNEERSASKVLPSPVANIYFGTRLIDVTKKLLGQTLSLEPERVTKPDWEILLVEAKSNVTAFRKFEKDHLKMASGCESGMFGCKRWHRNE